MSVAYFHLSSSRGAWLLRRQTFEHLRVFSGETVKDFDAVLDKRWLGVTRRAGWPLSDRRAP